MKGLFKIICITALFAVFAVPPQAEAQFSFRSNGYALDTLTNTASATFVFDKNLEEEFNCVLQVNNVELSGTATLTAILQQTLCATCTDWVNTDTLTFTATGNQRKVLTGEEFWGYRTRVVFATTGTGAHKFYATLALRRRLINRYG
jgi:hypothetical protein